MVEVNDKEMGLDLSGEDLLSSLMVEVNDKRERLAADKSCNGCLGDPFRENSFSIIKILEQKNSFSFYSIFSKDSIVSGDSKFKVIHHASSSEISLSSISCLILEEPNNRNRFALGISLGIIKRGKGLGRGASLLLQP